MWSVGGLTEVIIPVSKKFNCNDERFLSEFLENACEQDNPTHALTPLLKLHVQNYEWLRNTLLFLCISYVAEHTHPLHSEGVTLSLFVCFFD